MQQADNIKTLLSLTFPNAEWWWWNMDKRLLWTPNHDRVNMDLLKLIVAKFDGWKVWLWEGGDGGRIDDDTFLSVMCPQK